MSRTLRELIGVVVIVACLASLVVMLSHRSRVPDAAASVAPSPQASANVEPSRDDITARARRLTQEGKFQEALDLLEPWSRSHPQDVEVLHKRGYLHGALGRHEEALQDYRAAIALDTDLDMTYNNMGWEELCLGHTEEALRLVERSLQMNPDNGNAHDSRACVLATLGRWNEALRAADRACELRPDATTPRLHRTMILKRQVPPH